MQLFSRLPKVSASGLAARVFLAFLATAGLFYVNIMPAIVNGLIEALGYSNQQAGSVASANVYGAAFGALCIVPFVRRMLWQPVALVFLLVLVGIDLASLAISQPHTLVAVRFLHGFVGGMLVGTAFSVMARTEQPDRSFGMLLVVQYGLGGLGVMLIPGLVPMFGTAVLFLSLVAFTLVTLVMLAFLPEYHVDEQESRARAAAHLGVRTVPLALTIREAVDKALRIHAHSRDAVLQFLVPRFSWRNTTFLLDGCKHLRLIRVSTPALSACRNLLSPGGAR